MALLRIQDVIADMSGRLDADGTDHYNFQNSWKPGINYALDWFEGYADTRLGDSKWVSQNLRYLLLNKVIQLNSYGRIYFNEAFMGLLGPMRSIVAFYADIQTIPPNAPIQSLDPAISTVRTELAMLPNSGRPVKRLTHEQLADARQNVFQAGGALGNPNLVSYYEVLIGNSRTINSYPAQGEEWEIGPYPQTANMLVGVTYLRKIPLITSSAGDILLPDTCLKVIATKALEWIATRQGDNTTLYTIVQRELAQLLSTDAS